jgi:hypothetical protein
LKVLRPYFASKGQERVKSNLSLLYAPSPRIAILSSPVFAGAFTLFQILFFKLLCSFCTGCEEDPVHANAECTILARGPRPRFRREEDFGGKNREEKAGESDASATAASDASATAYHAILPLRLLLLQDRERRESPFQNKLIFFYQQFSFNRQIMQI